MDVMTKQKTVLLVESEDCLAAAMDHVVRNDGHACARLAPGDRLVPRLTADRPDLVMLDMTHCDRDDALKAFETIRRSAELRGVKILVLQSSGSALERRRNRAMGASATLSLPFQLDELRSEMRRLLDDGSRG